ncbi:MAG: STAS domain-containing protein [Chloroflexota bacterium]|nr:MAG: STAS domain-containing protein [Chloroflexota bacterium]
MNTSTFSAQVRENNNMAVIDLVGLINAEADQPFKQAYEEADGMDFDTIALNFAGVDYINSTGIALIVELLAMARKSHKRLVVYGLSEHYLEIFQITRLADFMDIYENESTTFTIEAGN